VLESFLFFKLRPPSFVYGTPFLVLSPVPVFAFQYSSGTGWCRPLYRLVCTPFPLFCPVSLVSSYCLLSPPLFSAGLCTALLFPFLRSPPFLFHFKRSSPRLTENPSSLGPSPLPFLRIARNDPLHLSFPSHWRCMTNPNAQWTKDRWTLEEIPCSSFSCKAFVFCELFISGFFFCVFFFFFFFFFF